jgi:long-chain acyl-CoA synthetase
MYPALHAAAHPQRPAYIMAGSGQVVSYRELDERSSRFAHLLRAQGLKRLDHYAVFMENNSHYVVANAAGERAGLYYTCINSYLTAEELAYILNNSEAQVLITSRAKRDVAAQALQDCPKVRLALIVDAPADATFGNFDAACAAFPATPIADEALGTSMLYSSGTTGRPKGVLRPLPQNPPSEALPLFHFLNKLWRNREGMVYLSPAPLYHAAPQAAVACAIRSGGTAIIMEHFDPEQYLALVDQYAVTHSQLVPTMFNRMLKLAPEVRERYKLSSLEVAVHAAAPCPVQVKDRMIEWWGPIIHEYYGATEGLGFTACDTEQWLAHRGSVGKVMLGDLHILDEHMQPSAKGVPGEIWFKTATAFEYFNDPQRTAQSRSADGTMTTVGDVGFVDDDGFLYLTDRSTFMIISGGVNIYPQECENLLVTHPKVADAAVFGVPNDDLGEEVKAVVQLMAGHPPGPALEAELIAFCQLHLATMKCPRSVEFDPALPRLPTGKLYKKGLRDKYWRGKESRIV